MRLPGMQAVGIGRHGHRETVSGPSGSAVGVDGWDGTEQPCAPDGFGVGCSSEGLGLFRVPLRVGPAGGNLSC